MSIVKSVAKWLSACLPLAFSAVVYAVPPHLPNLVDDGNRWEITFYNDNSPVHDQWATQGLCFFNTGAVGTHQTYVWVSDTYQDWNGRATQEGDQIFMHGDFQWPLGTKDGGHDGMEWEIVTSSPKSMGAGHWKEWIEDGRFGVTVGFGNTRLQGVGKCDFTSAEQAFEYGQTIPLREDANGKLQNNPMGIDLDVSNVK